MNNVTISQLFGAVKINETHFIVDREPNFATMTQIQAMKDQINTSID